MDEFLQQMLGLMQLSNQQRGMRTAEARQRGEMMAVYQNLKQNTTNPQLAEGLDRMFAPLTGRSVEDLAAFSELLTPNLATQQAFSSQTGYDSMTSPERTVVDQAAAHTVRSGLSEAQIGMGQDYLALPQTERATAAGVAAGTRLSAGQLQQGIQFVQNLSEQIRSSDANRDVSWATNRLGWATLLDSSALRMLGLEIDADAAAAAPEGIKFTQIMDLIAAYGTAQRDFQARKGSMSDDELQASLNFMRGLELQLINVGIIPSAGADQPVAPPAAVPGQPPVSGFDLGPRFPQGTSVSPAVPGDVMLPSRIPGRDWLRGRRF